LDHRFGVSLRSTGFALPSSPQASKHLGKRGVFCWITGSAFCYALQALHSRRRLKHRNTSENGVFFVFLSVFPSCNFSPIIVSYKYRPIGRI